MNSLSAIVIAAQDVEIAPFISLIDGTLKGTDVKSHPLFGTATRIIDAPSPTGRAWLAQTVNGKILMLRTGIGHVATASALGWALTTYRPRCVLSIGSAGGLAADANVMDVFAGSTYTYGTADATAFGYKLGQIPGFPPQFHGHDSLLDCVPDDTRIAMMLSGDSFITKNNVGDMREKFPLARTTDMESTSAAQTCTAWGIPFVSIRCVSDLCGPAADQDYHVAIEDAALGSALTTGQTLANMFSRRTQGRSPLFGRPAIDGALLLVFARAHRLKPMTDRCTIPAEILSAVHQQLTAHPAFIDEAIGLVSAAYHAIQEDPTLTLTAKKYDAERAKLVASLGVVSDRGIIPWPPTSQTVSKRSNGYWNDALASLGINVKTGRQRGTVKFTDADYDHAMETFAQWAKKKRMSTSVASYNEWIKDVGTGKYPSSAAIRQHFGTWRAAVSNAAM